VDRVLAAYSQSVSNGSGVVASNLAEGISLLGARVGSLADDGSLRIEATFRLEKEIRHAGLGIHIETMSGFELCDLRPETSGLVFGDRRGDFGVSFLLTDLCRHLAAGTYRLGLSFHETNWRRCLDRTPVGEFIVPSTDIYGTGFPPKQEKDGPLVVPVSDVHVG
jgi:hypothetical protein